MSRINVSVRTFETIREIPDYPMPGINEGTFTIHEDLGTVTDSFHRNYILEKV